MGPAGFCFAAQDILEDIGAKEGLLWQVWYMDDGTIIGTMEGLARAAEILLEEGPARGLFLNRAKCVLWGPGATEDVVRRLPPLGGMTITPFQPGTGVRVLGVPVEHPADTGAFTKAVLGKAVDSLDTMCSTLSRLPATHVQYTLLRFCLDGWCLNFLGRAASAFHGEAQWSRADGILRRTLGEVLGLPLSDSQWAQARLPQSLGGLGIRSPADMALPGRMAAMVDFARRGREALGLDPDLPLIQPDLGAVVVKMATVLGPLFQPLQDWTVDPGKIAGAEEAHARQHWWGERWHKAGAKDLPKGLVARDRVRFALQQAQRGAAWLGTCPAAGLGTELSNDECRALLRFWLGAPLIPEAWQAAPCPLCGQVLDTMGITWYAAAKMTLSSAMQSYRGLWPSWPNWQVYKPPWRWASRTAVCQGTYASGSGTLTGP
jgi:hypothetical protein